MYGLVAVAHALYDLLKSQVPEVDWHYGVVDPASLDRFPAGYVTGLASGSGERHREIPRGRELRWYLAVWIGTRSESGSADSEDAVLGYADRVLDAVSRTPTLGLANVVSVIPEPGAISTASVAPAAAYAEAELRFVATIMEQ